MEIKIYTLSSTREPNNVRYVGKTKQSLKRRLNGHLCDAKKAKSEGRFTIHNYNWINKELSEGYTIIISEIDSREFDVDEDWKWLEQYWISQFKSWGFKITNLTSGGDGNQDQVFSYESLEKKAEKLRGRPRDEETRRKISEGLTGVVRSEETKALVKDSITILQGRKIVQYDLDGNKISDWESIAEAARQTGIDKGNIGHCCNHAPNHNSAGGYIWRYENDNTPVVKYTPHSVCQLDLKGNLIAIFKTAQIAKEKTGVSTSSISNCCNGKIDSVKGFVFKKYKDFMNT